ncbi:SdpI family protein [Alkaliphilus hydrothermalis]|uniref:Membrane protein n=1 Tax=Alkaliphilus hydrothermalis TaxID=1482730 RepID=A0ABS2NT59_9FIRM|nr:SdpI family protein [Alkaliphilus hydrothermalis]MBM7616135.1 putative membrane protein [Alkaliphilus hydrothermalis]
MKSRYIKVYWVLAVLPLVVTLVAMPLFPEKVPMHYNAAGEITRWGSKYEQLIFPVIILAMAFLVKWMIKLTVKEESDGSNMKALLMVGASTLMLFNGMNSIILYNGYLSKTDIGTSIDLSKATASLLGIVLIIIGNVLPKCKQNAIIGIRTPWTLKDKNVWYKTHRVGGPVMMIGGIISTVITGIFLEGIVAQLFVVGILIVVSLILTIYSYRVYCDQRIKS